MGQSLWLLIANASLITAFPATKFPHMTAVELFILFLPFLLSLFGRGAMAKMLCLLSGILGLLLSVTLYGAVLPWLLGMLIAIVVVWERIRLLRTA
jgi:hypothetical protein